MAYHPPLGNPVDIRRAVPRGGLDDGTLPRVGLVHLQHELLPRTDSIPLRVRLAGPELDGQPCVDWDVGLVADLRLDDSSAFLGDDPGTSSRPRGDVVLFFDNRRLSPLDELRTSKLGTVRIEVGIQVERPGLSGRQLGVVPGEVHCVTRHDRVFRGPISLDSDERCRAGVGPVDGLARHVGDFQ